MTKVFAWKWRRNQWDRWWQYKAMTTERNSRRNCLISWTVICVVMILVMVNLRVPILSYSGDLLLSQTETSSVRFMPMQISNVDSVHSRHLLAVASSSVIGEESQTKQECNITHIYNSQCQNVTRNCSQASHGPAWETCDYELSTHHTALWVTGYSIIVIIIFIALAIVCDDFFVPSLEAISEKLHLSEDVAGATFMAAGSSAPELFSSIAAVTFESDVGVGTITGSAVFNLLVIISLTAAFAGQVLTIDWRPLMRDSTFYAVSIVWLIYSMWDTEIQVVEAVVLLLIYALYILTMVFNARLMDFLGTWQARWHKPTGNGNAVDINTTSQQDIGTGAIDNRRMSTASQYSMEAKTFRHDRRNSLLQALATPHGKLLPDSDKFASAGTSGAGGVGRKFSKLIVMQTFPEENESRESTPMRDLRDVDGLRFDTRTSANSQPGHQQVDNNQVCVMPDQDDDIGNNSLEDAMAHEEEEEEPRISCQWICMACPPVRGAPPNRADLEKDLQLEAQKRGFSSTRVIVSHWAMFFLKWSIFVPAFPFLVLFSWTIPDCSKPHNRQWFAVSFFTSVAWIAALSFGMVTVVARTGCLIGVDSFVMSLVVLAAGTSIPDLLSSIIVARDGFGDMAVSNAIGSNVFDIAMGLGLPFLIRLIINLGRPLDLFSSEERVLYCQKRMLLLPHVKFGFILLVILVFAQVAFILARFRLGKVIGISFFLTYLLFLAYAFVQEFQCTYNC